jgi:hypothetical protein
MAMDILLPLLRQSRPCPFATVENQDLHELRFEQDLLSNTAWIVCGCGARSPAARQPVDTVKRWNTRYADIQISLIGQKAGAAVIAAQGRVDDAEAKFAAMQVENNKLLERAQTAEASLELPAKLAEKAATDHG